MRGKTIVMAAAAMALLPATADAAAAQAAPQGGLHLVGRAREEAIQCMAQAIRYEAGHEPETGQSAVARVILNRLNDPAYPKTVCGVVYQGSRRRTGCQFTFTCDGSLARSKPGSIWPAAERIATLAIDGGLLPTVDGALNYHADYVQPDWAAHLVRVGQIGAHVFYRPGSGGSMAHGTAAAIGPRSATLTVWGLTAATLTPVGGTVAVQRYWSVTTSARTISDPFVSSAVETHVEPGVGVSTTLDTNGVGSVQGHPVPAPPRHS